jgi:hypothetical protein
LYICLSVIVLSGICRFLLIEEAFDVDIGHAETEALVEQHMRALEGDRASRHPQIALYEEGPVVKG